MSELAKTKSSFLKEVLQDLEQDILEPGPSRVHTDGFKKGYLKALEDVFDRMG